MSHDDELARLRADMDQAREGMKELAGNLWAFYNELTAEGFQAAQALALCRTFLAGMIENTGGSGEE